MADARTRLAASLAVLGVLVATGCGSTSAGQHRSAAAVKSQVGIISPATSGGEAVVGASPVGAGADTSPQSPVQRARRAGSDERVSASGVLDPCRLVRRSELQALIRSHVTGVTEAPLGPTCVYALGSKLGEVTLAVQPGSLSTLSRQPAGQRLTVAHHRAYCSRASRESLLVAASGGRVLTIAAPCRMAIPVARRALARL